jgi:hypothetical protein
MKANIWLIVSKEEFQTFSSLKHLSSPLFGGEASLPPGH